MIAEKITVTQGAGHVRTSDGKRNAIKWQKKINMRICK